MRVTIEWSDEDNAYLVTDDETGIVVHGSSEIEALGAIMDALDAITPDEFNIDDIPPVKLQPWVKTTPWKPSTLSDLDARKIFDKAMTELKKKKEWSNEEVARVWFEVAKEWLDE